MQNPGKNGFLNMRANIVKATGPGVTLGALDIPEACALIKTAEPVDSAVFILVILKQFTYRFASVFCRVIYGCVTYFLRIFLTPANPSNPKPKRNSVHGSGTALELETIETLSILPP